MKKWIGFILIVFSLGVFSRDLIEYFKDGKFSSSGVYFLLLGTIFVRGLYDVISHYSKKQ